MTRWTLWRRAAAGLLSLAAMAMAIVAVLYWQGAPTPQGEQPDVVAVDASTVARGAYLARLGNCMGCHTSRGGAPYAGDRAITTPFGTFYTSNLTSDEATGIGAWTANDFWSAMHHGVSKKGRLLYPAFPYTSYTHVTRADSDALYAYLRTVPAVAQATRPHALRFPYGTQVALAVWRSMYFRPRAWQDDPQRSPEWNRGLYLVQGLGHCAACHTPRNALGASSEAHWLRGGAVAGQNWYAPSLADPSQAGLQNWSVEDIVALLRVGTSERGSVSGPMAEVVRGSTQHMSDADARAMARYLQELPEHAQSPADHAAAPAPAEMQKGQAIYKQHCAQCHGEAGEGVEGAFPALAGNRAVLLHTPSNVIAVVLRGGYLPATAGNPRPHGMPPFLQTLSDQEIADVSTFVRNAWGNRASAVGTIDVYRARESDGS
ncbi:MAG: c-type cytochrome [Comamonadaceae bacterium]|nr:MAG: c-type cytochrome [Comamonadaceae bacterium]